MQRRRSLIVVISVLLALILVTFISGSLSAPDGNQAKITPDDGKPIMVSGRIVCLPHRDTSGPVTLECAYGIQGDNGDYYALSDTTPDHILLSGIATGTDVQVEGIFRSSTDDKYQQLGTIEVKAVVE